MNGTLCLGLVVLPKPGCVGEAISELSAESTIELGPIEAGSTRLPACAFCPVGADEALLARLETLPHVLRVDVVFANILEENLP